MSPTTAKQWILVNKPVDLPDNNTFKLVETPLPELKENQVLAKTLYLSNDPAQRGWIQKDQDPTRLYFPPVGQDAPMSALGIAEVVESKSSNFPKGTIVHTVTNWSEYNVFDTTNTGSGLTSLMPVQKIGALNETHFLGAFGLTGITAYHGLEVVRTKAEDVLVVSGAAGATGSMVVQIAKHLIGCKRVVGIAGTDEKCKWVESIGADVCINYKSPSFKEDLIKVTEEVPTVYFDNVGGEILDLMLCRMGRYSRIAACGSISGYNNYTEGYHMRNWFEVVSMRIEIRGLIVLDAGEKMPQYVGDLIQAYKDGKIKLSADNETVVPTKFEDIPKTWMKLFSGANTGKLVTSIV